MHLPHSFRSRAEPGPQSPICLYPAAPLPPPFHPSLRLTPKLVSFALQLRSTCIPWSDNILCSLSLFTLCNQESERRQHEKQGPCHPHLYPTSPVLVCWWLVHLYQESQNQQTGIPGAGKRCPLPYLCLYLLLSSAVVLLVLVGSQNLLLDA